MTTYRFQFRRDSDDDLDGTTVLLEGEPGVAWDGEGAPIFKIGDGVSTWDELPEAGGGGAVDSVNGETGAVVLDAADVGADPSGTAATAVTVHTADTTAVHGIADTSALVVTSDARLSDARTPTAHTHPAADIASGTVATARLGTGAANATTFLRGDQTWAAAGGSETLPASIIDAKGDVIVGTAADTAARLGVGTDGQVLTADSAETSGVKWAAAAGGGQRARGLTSTNWVGSSAPAGATTPTANQMDLHTVGNASCWPVWLAAGTYDRIAVYVGTAGTATLRLGLSYSAADGGVGAPAWDAGTINVTSTGRTEITGSVTLVEGWYWTVVMTESYTATFNLYGRSWTQNDIRNGISLEPTSFRQYGSVRHAGIPTGSLPDLSSYPAYGSLYGPIVALRRA